MHFSSVLYLIWSSSSFSLPALCIIPNEIFEIFLPNISIEKVLLHCVCVCVCARASSLLLPQWIFLYSAISEDDDDGKTVHCLRRDPSSVNIIPIFIIIAVRTNRFFLHCQCCGSLFNGPIHRKSKLLMCTPLYLVFTFRFCLAMFIPCWILIRRSVFCFTEKKVAWINTYSRPDKVSHDIESSLSLLPLSCLLYSGYMVWWIQQQIKWLLTNNIGLHYQLGTTSWLRKIEAHRAEQSAY